MESNVILTDRDVDHVLGAVLPNVSIGLREAVSNVYAAVQRIAPIDQRENNESMDRNFAIFAKGYYRMLRILTNMSDAFELSEAAKPCLPMIALRASVRGYAQALPISLIWRAESCASKVKDRPR